MAVSDLITLIDAKIKALLEDTSNVCNYRIGDKRVAKCDYLDSLIQSRGKLQAMDQDETPYEDIREIATDIDQFGDDNSEYIGDAF